MRINRENTLIEDNSFPLAGMRESDIIDYFTDKCAPYSYIFEQVQTALYLHNIPLYSAIVIMVALFLYILRAVNNSRFPTIFFLIMIYPIQCFFLKIGGNNIINSLCIDINTIHETEPNRIRSVREIVSLSWKPVLFCWRMLFFVYRVFVLPNTIDIIVLIIGTVIIGLILSIINGVFILGLILCLFLIFPPLLTRNSVYKFLMVHLGNPIVDKPKID